MTERSAPAAFASSMPPADLRGFGATRGEVIARLGVSRCLRAWLAAAGSTSRHRLHLLHQRHLDWRARLPRTSPAHISRTHHPPRASAALLARAQGAGETPLETADAIVREIAEAQVNHDRS